MVRQLKHHEQRLLKKVDFAHYKQESVRENTVMVKYQLEKRGEYLAYNSIAGQIRKLATKLSLLDPKDPYGQEKTDAMLEKLFKMGLITAKNIAQCEKITVSAFCRRRLAVVMVRIKMAETIAMAVQYIGQGHVRVGPNIVTDAAFLVSRNLEDYVTWSENSKIKRTIQKYNDQLDDFDLL